MWQCQNLLKYDQGFSLVKEPLTFQKLANLFEVKKQWVIEIIGIRQYFSFFEENQIFRNDVVFGDYGKLGNLIKFTLLEHLFIILSRCLFLLSRLTFFYLLFLLIVLFTLLIGFFTILIVFRILRDKILQLFIVNLQFLLVLSFKEFVCLNRQYFSIWILWKQLVEFVAYADQCLEYSFMCNL